eukprot:TRINITY_DN10238_c0_g2_i1.p1 TRINITY_DN10238_c0_g2~~TRINITY_DN10238_c0_g2_i1.p1  ORF type:complete len:902 (+),score=181.51 TRINITY_DN10238_c0_g2_i1:235-2940(+)
MQRNTVFANLWVPVVYVLLLLSSGASCSVTYTHWPDTAVNGGPANVVQQLACGGPQQPSCNISALMSACDANTGCIGFSTNGSLFSCAGCDARSPSSSGQPHSRPARRFATPDATGNNDVVQGTPGSCCLDKAPGVDLYLAQRTPPPADWQAAVAGASMLFASPEPGICFMPEVGNGFFGTVVSSASVYISGLFNGVCGGTTKARIPSTAAISVNDFQLVASALDMLNGVYRRRYTDGNGSTVEQRFYAHRVMRNILVSELELLSGSAATLNLSTLFDPSQQQSYGTECGSLATKDLVLDAPSSVGADVVLYAGRMVSLGDEGEVFRLSIVTQNFTVGGARTVVLSPGSVLSFISAIATSIEFPGNNATSADVSQRALAAFDVAQATGSSALLKQHTAAWEELWQSRVEITSRSDQRTVDADQAGNLFPNNDTVIEYDLALAIAQHYNSSMYYLLSSVRADWPGGACPGGVATLGGYEGVLFFDMDWYVMPGRLHGHPDLARSLLDARYDGLPAAFQAATVFGYKGAMFPWTSAYLGRPSGCCSGTGPYEDCLEQHTAGDVGVAVMQYYHSTGDSTWLQAHGWPLLEGAADFLTSRVSLLSPGVYGILGVLPVDEWCDDAATHCLTKGINNDVHSNAVAKVALSFAAYVSEMLGYGPRPEWQTIAAGMKIGFNSTGGFHIQFDGSCTDCLAPNHYVCPEDVLYLTYPMSDALNVSPAVSLNDANTYVPITCEENAGMTTPIHTIVWLQLGDSARAEDELYRDMYGACYGPFNVRNEVDLHANIVGGKFLNTHFLTGDGGFAQAIQNGYLGLKITSSGLQWSPTLPTGAEQIAMKGLYFSGSLLDIAATATTLSASVQPGNGMLCLVDANHKVYNLFPGKAIVLPLTAFALPGVFRSCGTMQ